jgi:hypothetical protein
MTQETETVKSNRNWRGYYACWENSIVSYLYIVIVDEGVIIAIVWDAKNVLLTIKPLHLAAQAPNRKVKGFFNPA